MAPGVALGLLAVSGLHVGAVTVTDVLPLAPFDSAVMIAVPCPTPVIVAASPDGVTVATDASLVRQVTNALLSTRTEVPSFFPTCALADAVEPGASAMDSVEGVTVMVYDAAGPVPPSAPPPQEESAVATAIATTVCRIRMSGTPVGEGRFEPAPTADAAAAQHTLEGREVLIPTFPRAWRRIDIVSSAANM